MSLIRAMATVGGLTGVSRVVGFIRDMMTAYFLGAGPVADAFVVALKLPNFFRHVTAEGAFSVSFVPIYSESLHKEGEGEAGRFAGQAFSAMLAILSLFTLIVLIAMPYVIYAIAPGFKAGTEQYDLAVELTRITFPYLLLMSLAALIGGMLNAHDKFGPFAAASIFFNICQIGFMIVSDRFFDTVGHALAWAVTVSGVVQLAWLWWYLRKYNIRLPIIRPVFGGKVKRLFKLMTPGILGAGIIHVNLFADIVIASSLPTGAISALYYADRLFQLPLGVVGIAVGTALLPMLTKALAADRPDEARDLFNRALEYCLFFTVPATAALMVITGEIVQVLFQHGEFSLSDAARTTPALACLSLGLPAYVGVKIFSSAYWSRQDTKTPVRIAASMAVVNIGVALVLTRFMDVAGLALATGMAGWVQCYFLWRGIRGNEATMFDARLTRAVPRIFASAALMGLVLLAMARLFHDWFYDGTGMHEAAALIVTCAVGGVSYFIAAHFTGVLRLGDLNKYLTRRKRAEPDAGKVLVEEIEAND